MTDHTYYVYALFHQDGVPFYIGAGRGDRWLQHEQQAKWRRTQKDHLIMAMRHAGIRTIPKSKLAQGLTRKEALEAEVAFIAAIGRIPKGPLVNQTAGGEGVKEMGASGKAAISAKLRARWADPEKAAQLKAGMRAALSCPQRRAERSHNAKQQMLNGNFALRDPEVRAKAAAATAEALRRPDVREKRSAAIRKAYENPELTARLSAIQTEISSRPGERERRSARAKSQYANPQARLEQAERSAASNGRPEVRAKISDALRAWALRPGSTEVRRAAARKAWAKRRAALAQAQIR